MQHDMKPKLINIKKLLKMIFNAEILINGKIEEIGVYAPNLEQAKLDAAKFGEVISVAKMSEHFQNKIG